MNQISNFPQEVVEKMLEHQVKQGNPRNRAVFEKKILEGSSGGGFLWSATPEGDVFWRKVIEEQDFDHFFQLYSKGAFVAFEPKVMEVSYNNRNWTRRVVFGKKNGRYIAWSVAQTLEEAVNYTETGSWDYAREPVIEISEQEIREKFSVPDGVELRIV